jgi:GT2 family glycosyltransferase/glycosyltransferase involved in cell wall biosynthesis
MSAAPPSPADVLWLLAPRRVVLIGPDGPVLRAALAWSRTIAGVSVIRAGDATGARFGDLLVSQNARRLPAQIGPLVSALIPANQTVQAESRGWVPLAADGLAAVLRRVDSSAGLPEPRLETYARSRIVMSQEMELLGVEERNGDTPVRPLTHAAAGAGVSIPAATPSPPPAGRGAGGPPPLSVIVPIHNAADELRRCLRSLSLHTTWPCELVLIDDASVEPAIAEVLAEAALLDGVRILRNTANLGFTATVNRGLRSTRGDVVVLNSDTEVGPRWLEHLVRAARSRPAVATVTPLSDNAGAFAVPIVGEPNETPLGLDLPSVARRVAQIGQSPVAVPTGNGFCLYIARQALETVGYFDTDMFPRGYGEENDFCLRALRAGWTHLADPATFVHHVRDASFGSERPELMKRARARIDEAYPEYTALVREFVSSEEMVAVRDGVQDAYRRTDLPRPRLLTIIHEGGGGTWVANLELVRALKTEWEPFVFTSDRRTLRLWQVVDGELEQLREWTLERSIRATDFSRPDYIEVVRSALEQYEIELVHVRHLFKHTFDAPRVAAELGVPVLFSFHDSYFVCPTVNLLDDRDTYCGGQCTPGDGNCRIPDAGLDGLPHLKHSYVFQWREEVEAMLSHVDALVTTSAHAREVHRRALPLLAGRPFELIEHGRDLRQQVGVAVEPEPGGPIRILVMANLDVHKGAEYIRSLREADSGGRLTFHFLGAVPPEYEDLGECHGTFAPEELTERAAAIAPAFAGNFSIVAETYSHSLTEAWALGVPVIANDIGALGERVRAHGGGRLTPLGDVGEAVRRIYAAAEPQEWEQLRVEASLRGCATVEDMSDAYGALYRQVIDARRPLAAGAGGPVQLRPGVVKMLAVVPGAHGVHPGSTYVRILQRYRHSGVRDKLSLSIRRADEDPLARDADLVLVQRTALDPGTAEDFIATLRDRGIPLALDLDDHLLIKGADDPDYGPHQEALAALIDAASLVLVSTERLALALRERARAVAVVPNLIDEHLFFSGIEDRPRAEHAPSRRPLQIVYVGSPTHAQDLQLLRPVMDELAERAPGRFELNVVGAELPGAGQDWYRRIIVPDDCKPYPRFVSWLREQRPAWDVAVAPLAAEEFNRYKSDLKYLEYAALGLAGVYSDFEPYETVIDRETGLKVGEVTEQWVEALLALSEDPALSDVTAHRLMRHGTEDLLHTICTVGAPRTPAPDGAPELAVTGL